MGTITDYVSVLRSKNANPYEITIDLIFEEWDDYHYVTDNELITEETITETYDIPLDEVTVFVYYDPAKAIKATIKRPIHSGGIGDSDIYGAQQYAPLLDLEIPDPPANE
ncbi:DUF4387 domain-containing protein [Halorussus salinisoli]|uniref:DUF4387 domain-containing protein n=1 Tax=Halorussus salinisoli TaxID=2558242 RepID=UPI0010C197CC|nr:DUF4387 family protein [Halorussus salinisoli]